MHLLLSRAQPRLFSGNAPCAPLRLSSPLPTDAGLDLLRRRHLPVAEAVDAALRATGRELICFALVSATTVAIALGAFHVLPSVRERTLGSDAVRGLVLLPDPDIAVGPVDLDDISSTAEHFRISENCFMGVLRRSVHFFLLALSGGSCGELVRQTHHAPPYFGPLNIGATTLQATCFTLPSEAPRGNTLLYTRGLGWKLLLFFSHFSIYWNHVTDHAYQCLPTSS